MESIIAAVITGVLTLIGVVVTNISSNRKVEASLEKAQAVTDTKIEELTREVREHNNFARRMPVVEHDLEGIHHTLEELKSYHRPTT